MPPNQTPITTGSTVPLPCNASEVTAIVNKLRVVLQKRGRSPYDVLNALALLASEVIMTDIEKLHRDRIREEFIEAFRDFMELDE
jgi:uncharacterized protein YejL (UPF0352 family)